jgi:hypothetical protein
MELVPGHRLAGTEAAKADEAVQSAGDAGHPLP